MQKHIIKRTFHHKIIEKLTPVWTSTDTWVDAAGGRGAGKSYEVNSKMLYDAMYLPPNSLLASAREFQNSIADSNHQVMSEQIIQMELEEEFDVQQSKIVCKRNRNKIIFPGLARNISSFLSKANLKRLHIEEASYVSLNSFRLIIPTMSRNPGIRIYVTRNPLKVTDPTFQMFQATDAERTPDFKYDMRDRHTSIRINWPHNHHLTRETHPEWFEEVDALFKNDYEEAMHVYGGQVWNRTDALVFKPNHWRTAQEQDLNKYEPNLYKYKCVLGADFGDTNPSTLIESYINRQDREIYIRNEIHETKCNPNELAHHYARLPAAQDPNNLIIADSNNPMVIRELQNHPDFNFNIRGARKAVNVEFKKSTTNSYVKDGLIWLKGFKIIIHPQCQNTIKEFQNYSFEIDEQTEEVKDRIVKEHDHCIDAIRYSIEDELYSTGDSFSAGGFAFL